MQHSNKHNHTYLFRRKVYVSPEKIQMEDKERKEKKKRDDKRTNERKRKNQYAKSILKNYGFKSEHLMLT